MPTVEELLRRAAECRRIAPHCTTPGLTEELLAIAADLEHAAKLAQTVRQSGRGPVTTSEATSGKLRRRPEQARRRAVLKSRGPLRSTSCF
jgi:hypothetical protein